LGSFSGWFDCSSGETVEKRAIWALNFGEKSIDGGLSAQTELRKID